MPLSIHQAERDKMTLLEGSFLHHLHSARNRLMTMEQNFRAMETEISAQPERLLLTNFNNGIVIVTFHLRLSNVCCTSASDMISRSFLQALNRIQTPLRHVVILIRVSITFTVSR